MNIRFAYFLVTLLVLGSLNVLGADSSSTVYEKNIYRKSWNFGFLLHTRGLGLNFRREKFKTALLKNFWTIEGYNIKSAKEQKSYGSSGDNSKSFIYGKLNHLYVIKGGIGRQKVMFEKEVVRGVQISTIYNINFALGFLKPIYLEVFKRDQNNPISTERYDPTIHRLGEISGKASWFRGLDEMEIVPGLGAKFALNFEFAPKDNKIKALETGVNVDAFMKPMPIMAFQSDQYVFVNLYLNFQFGRKRYL
ncbi:MAG: hypothetical protein CL840_22450 [Crocinitomicaceae bacterium]|nr:hypothetical protein [Crocinitomicaceae bacterium]|tara:strand:+ start:3637 stop:4386 length:750 start_codon:yes stop_codon:yes gene_type:complete